MGPSMGASAPRHLTTTLTVPLASSWGDRLHAPGASQQPAFMSALLLAHSIDTYGGANVDEGQLPDDAGEFEVRLLESLHAWAQQGVKGVWLKLPIHLSQLVPVAVKHGFEYHSAAADRVVLCRWLPASSSLLPNGPTAQVGVGAYILSSDDKILLVWKRAGQLPPPACGRYRRASWSCARMLVRR